MKCLFIKESKAFLHYKLLILIEIINILTRFDQDIGILLVLRS